MAQLAKCLLNKHGDLRSIPRAHVEKLGMMACAHNYSTGEAEAGPANLARLASSRQVRDTLLK